MDSYGLILTTVGIFNLGRKDIRDFEEAQALLLLDVPLVAMPRGSGSGLSWDYSRKES